MSDLLEQVERSILERALFRHRERILIAVSGGVDSMVLLYVLQRLALRNGWKLTVAHFNHQLRGRSSDADERLVRRTAAALRLAAVIGRADVRKFARRYRLSTEMAARKVRHNFLARTAAKLRILRIALAHHADDQVELFFLRLLRGSGSEGLAGMKWSNPSPANPAIRLVRPLLDQPKERLRAYAAEQRIKYREDASNVLPDMQRNRLRHELLPFLRKEFQPALDRTVLRVMEILTAESDFVGQAASDLLGRARGRSARFGSLPTALQRRCLFQQLVNLGVAPEFELVEQLRREPCRPVCVTSGKVTRDSKGQILLQPMPPVGFASGALNLELAGGAGEAQFDQVRFAWQVGSGRPRPWRVERVAGQEIFDADRVGQAIRLRHWKPGDRFQPIGMKSAVKLQDLFVNQKVQRGRRHELIVAETAKGEVFWVEGLRIGEQFKLTNPTIRRLHWRWQRL